MARPAGLDHRFAERREARGDLETAAAWPTRGLRVSADAATGVVDWRFAFPDGAVGIAQSRVIETIRGTCIYSFVLHAPPVALQEVEGALETQRGILQSELATLKSLMER